MPTRRELYEEIAARHEREHRADTRARRRYWVRAALLCWAWALIGLVLGGYAFHTTDPEIGRISLLAGQLVTLVGVLGTLGRSVIEAERRGWW